MYSNLLKLLFLLPLTLASPTPAVNISVSSQNKYQEVDGFGISEAFGHAAQIATAPDSIRTQVLDLLFSTTEGAGLTILRNIIYSGAASIEPNSPVSPTVTPKYVWNGSDSSQLWLSKAAQSYGVNTFYANSWSAPAFMKTNNDDSNGGYLCGVTGETCATGDWRQAFANYLEQYIKFYNESGVKITHLGFLNEPDSAFTYASMQSNGTQAASFIKVLYPTLQKSGYSDVKITCCDAEGWESERKMLQDLEAAGAGQEIGIVTSHGYTSPPGAPFVTLHNVWMTEWADLNDVWSTSWAKTGTAEDGIYWASRIQKGLVESNISGWINWQGASKSNSSDELIRFSNTTVEASGRLWAYAHFGRFVRPGAVRIAATSTNTNVTVSAFEKSGKLTLQVINTAAGTVSLSMSGFDSFSEIQPVLTDESNEFEYLNKIPVTNGEFGLSVPGKSMLSFVST